MSSRDDPGGAGPRDLPQMVDLHREARHRRQLMERPDLTYLFWESTLRCNLKCTHCGSSCDATSRVEELSTEQVLGILDTIGEDFDTSRIFVSITGGEPLLRPDLFEVVQRLTDLGMESCIVTNGTLLTRERAARLVAAGMRTVSISLDGAEAEHDAVRGKGSFTRALAGVTAAREAGIEFVETITCVRPANLESLDRVSEDARAAGSNLWRLITIDSMGRLSGRPDPEMWLDSDHLRQLMAYIETRRQAAARAGDPGLDVQFSCGGFLGVALEGQVRPDASQCYAGLCVGSILCDGRVGACPSMPRAWSQGSALEQRFSTIWRERFDDYRDLDGPGGAARPRRSAAGSPPGRGSSWTRRRWGRGRGSRRSRSSSTRFRAWPPAAR